MATCVVTEAGREARKARVVIAPDNWLPSQQGARYQLPCVNERRLLLAVLEDAVKIAQRPHMHTDDNVRLALAWIADECDWGIFSFVGLCGVFEIDPSWVRRGIADGSFVMPSHSVRRVETRAVSHPVQAEKQRRLYLAGREREPRSESSSVSEL